MSIKTYQHPETKEIRTPNPDNPVEVAAVKKLGYVELTAKDVEEDEGLTVTYETVSKGTPATEPPALPKLTKEVPPGPTRDESQPTPATPKAITREDVK